MRLLKLCILAGLLSAAPALARGGAMPATGRPNSPMPRMSAASTAPAESGDARHVIPLTATERNLVLADMRRMLASEQAIIGGLARGDMKVVAKAASESGTGMMRGLPPAVRMKFPTAFLQMGMATHRIFDRIAAEAGSSKNSEHTLELLAEATRYCVACHASYRLGPE